MESNSDKTASCWIDWTCIACHFDCKSALERLRHEREAQHIKKVLIFNFLSNECTKPVIQPPKSRLFEEFCERKETGIGLECLIEIQAPSKKQKWWVCSLCHEAGNMYETAFYHIQKFSHLDLYIKTFHPSRRTIIPNKSYEDCCNYTDYIVSLAQALYLEIGTNIRSPDVLLTDLNDGKLGNRLIQPNKDEGLNLYRVEAADQTRRRYIMKCSLCFEALPCHDENRSRIWEQHKASFFHIGAIVIRKYLRTLGSLVETVMEEPPYEILSEWISECGAYYGPLCGLNYLIKSETNGYCMLCFELIKSVEVHFSSEYHISRFVFMKNGLKAFSLIDKTGVVRRQGYLEILKRYSDDNSGYKKLLTPCIPEPIQTLFRPFQRLREMAPTREKYFADTDCICCETCRKVIPLFDKEANIEAVWNDHTFTFEHFDACSRQNTYYFDEANFVPFISQFELPCTDGLEGWTYSKIGTEAIRVLPFAAVGLEFLVDNLDNGELVCTLCGEAFRKDGKIRCQGHITSYDHIYKYLTYTNKVLAYLLSNEPTREGRESIMHDYLKRNLFLEVNGISYQPKGFQGKLIIRVYSVKASEFFEHYVNIPSNYGSSEQKLKLGTIVKNSCCRVKEVCSIKLSPASKVVVFCLECNVLFTCILENLATVIYQVHLATDSHIRRSTDLCMLKMTLNGFVTKRCLNYNDKSDQTYWVPNMLSGLLEYTRRPVGLNYIVERRSLTLTDAHTPDYYCRLCVMRIPINSAALEDHVRSMNHIILYMQFTNPIDFFQILDLSDNPAIIQEEVAAWCRTRPVRMNDSIMLVFDPSLERKLLGYSIARFREIEGLNAVAEKTRALKLIHRVLAKKIVRKPVMIRNRDVSVVPANGALDEIEHADPESSFKEMPVLKCQVPSIPQLAASLSSFTKSILNAKNISKVVAAPKTVQTVPPRCLLDEDYYSDDSVVSGGVVTASEIVGRSGEESLAECNSLSTNIGEFDSMEKAVQTFLRFEQEKIPEIEMPTAINQKIDQAPEILGVESVFQILCSDDESFHTFFCSICKMWLLEEELISHFGDYSHRVNYMKIHHRPFYNTLMKESDRLISNSMLNEYAKHLMQSCGEKCIIFRLKCRILRACADVILFKKDRNLAVKLRPDPIESHKTIKLYKKHRLPMRKGVAKRTK